VARLRRHHAAGLAVCRRRPRRQPMSDPLAARVDARAPVLLGRVRVRRRFRGTDRRHEHLLLAPAARSLLRRTHGGRPVRRALLQRAVPAVVGQVGVGADSAADEARDGDRAGRHGRVRHLLDAEPRRPLHESAQAVDVRRERRQTDPRRCRHLPRFEHYRAGAHLRLQLLQPVYLLPQQQ